MMMSVSRVSSAKLKRREKKPKQNHESWYHAESEQMAGKTTGKKNSFVLNSNSNIYIKMLNQRKVESNGPEKKNQNRSRYSTALT